MDNSDHPTDVSEEQIDLLSLDVMQLKALAYDQLAMIEQGQANLRTINERINQLTAKTNGKITA